MQKVQGWVENGNITVSIASTGYVSSTKVQGSFPAGTVTVYLAGTLALATIYSDDLLSPTAKANPFTAASTGLWFFYAANAKYDIKFSGGGISAPFTLGDVELFDPRVVDGVMHAALFSGADASIKIANAIAALPSTGGIVDARGFAGSQTFSTNPFAGIPSVTFPLTVLFGAATFHVQTTMKIALAASILIRGASGGGEIETGTTFQWDGANGGTVLFFDTTRDSFVEGINIIPGTGTVGIGILTDNVNPIGSSNITNLKFSRIGIAASTTGIQIGKDQLDGNNAELTFEDVTIFGAGTYGYYIKFSQSRNISITRGTVANRTTGIYHNNGSSRIYGINFSDNTLDIYVTQSDDTIFIEGCHSELSRAFLGTGGYSGANFAAYLIGNSFTCGATTVNPMLEYKYIGPFVMIGNDFTVGEYHATPKFNLSTNTNATIISIGNVFPNDQVFTGAGATYKLTSIGDRTFDAAQIPQPMPDLTQRAISLTALLTAANITITGALIVPTITGNTTVTADLTVGDDLVVTDDLSVGDDAAITGDATVGGTLGVTGAATAASLGLGGEAAQAHLLSGTYTPTLTNVFNVSASSLAENPSYIQIGKCVIVSGQLNITPTASGNVSTEVDLSVPILNGSNIDAMGGAVTTGAVGLSGVATFEVSFGNGNKIRLSANQVSSTGAITYSFIVMYHLS